MMSNSESRKRQAELAAQSPAPDPDETCEYPEGCGSDGVCRTCMTPTPPATTGTPSELPVSLGVEVDAPTPATTGPADEAEGLARLLIEVWICGRCGRLPVEHAGPASDCIYDPVLSRRSTDAILASDWLEADRRAQQRIGAEKAWDEGYDAALDSMRRGVLMMGAGVPAPLASKRTPNPYRSDRIAREGQADV